MSPQIAATAPGLCALLVLSRGGGGERYKGVIGQSPPNRLCPSGLRRERRRYHATPTAAGARRSGESAADTAGRDRRVPAVMTDRPAYLYRHFAADETL